MHLLLAERDRNAENLPFAFAIDATSDEHRSITNLAINTHFFVARIEKQVRAGTEWAIAPLFQYTVQLPGRLTDLGGRHRTTAEFFGDGGDFAGRDALHIHLSQGKRQRSLTA